MKKRRMGSANIHLQKLDLRSFFLKGLPRNRLEYNSTRSFHDSPSFLLMRLIIKK